MPRLLYFKVPAPAMEAGLARMLENVQAEGSSAYKTFAGAAELRTLVLTDLATMLAERFVGTGRDGRTGRDAPRQAAPSPVTSLVGRDNDINEVAGLLNTRDRRLVVLTGACGIGKTRLALAVMERTKAHWRDGAAFVDLSAVTDPQLVPDAVAAALGLVVQGRERPLDALGRRLAGRNMLIVVDNFEQVLEAAPMLADLLQRAPELHLLVTSRVVLRVRGEQEWPVAPLAEAPAVRLFVERVRDVQPGFELTRENARAVAELCRRLNGLPLALELAAAWMRLLTPDQMLARLYEHLDRPGGAIINFSSSVLGRIPPTYTGYAISKAAVEATTFILAHELRGRDVTVNAVAPGPTATDMFLEGKDQELLDRLANAAPLERLGVPDDIAPVVAFLASPEGH